MSQQIAIEDALAAFRKKCADLTDANVLLEARAAVLERRIAELEHQLAQQDPADEPAYSGDGQKPSTM
jgi:prefoldin subunit 5